MGAPKSPIRVGEARTRLILSVDRELLSKRHSDDSLLLARPEQGRKSGSEDECVCDENSDHQRIRSDRSREIETESRAAPSVGCLVRCVPRRAAGGFREHTGVVNAAARMPVSVPISTGDDRTLGQAPSPRAN